MPTNNLMRRIQKYIVCFLTIFTLLNVRCSPLEKQFGIIFSANLDGNQDLYSVYSQNLQSIERLTFTSNVPEQNLKLTKNGDHLLFSTPVPNLAWTSYVLDLKTKTVTDLRDNFAELRSVIPLSWSIDENQVLLLEKQDTKLYIVDLNRKDLKEFEIPHTFDLSIIDYVNYSPNGNQIAYREYHQSPTSIFSSFIFDLMTKEVIPLSSNRIANCSHPKWSPNGKQILLYCDLSTDGMTTDNHMYLLDIVKNDTLIIKETGDFPCGFQLFWAPDPKFAWSPDGKQFVATFCTMSYHSKSLTIFNSDGSLYKEIPFEDTLDNPIYISSVSWPPDGKKIFYIAGKDEYSLNIYMIDRDGSNNYAITNEPSNYRELSVYSLEP